MFFKIFQVFEFLYNSNIEIINDDKKTFQSLNFDKKLAGILNF